LIDELGDLLTAYLEKLGIEYVFGVPGGAIEPLLNALARSARRGGPRCVVCRHETGGAFMADGYYSVTGKMGVCFATTGPGATNLVTGVASAHANNVPLLVITAQTALNTFGRGALQESSCTGTDTLSIFESITRYNSLISHPDQFEHKLAAAIITAHRSPPGPVHLSVPVDVMKSLSGRSPQYRNLPELLAVSAGFDRPVLDRFLLLLGQSRQTVFVLGNESEVAAKSIVELATSLDIPLVVTPSGKGLVDPCHPLFRGAVGFAGHATAVETLRDPAVDLIVVIGTGLGEWASNGWDSEAMLNERMVHISPVENHFLGSPMARLHLRGDIDLVFDEVQRHFRSTQPPLKLAAEPVTRTVDGYCFALDEPQSCTDDSTPILPQRLMAELPRLFPANTRYFADSGNSFAWAVHYLHVHDHSDATDQHTTRLFRASLDFASMGWAIASSVGAALALRDSPVVCITGDGSYLMAGQEISVAIQEQLPLIYLILNDAGYGMVKHGQRLTGAEQTGFELPFIDFAAMARAMGVEGHVIESIDDLQALDINHICNRPGPTLLDVRIDREAKPPIGLRTRILRGES